MVATSELVPKKPTNVSQALETLNQKKKKRPNRQRNRPRNKRNRLQINNESEIIATPAAQVQSAEPPTVPQKPTSNKSIEASTVALSEKKTKRAPALATMNPTTSARDAESDKTREQILAEREAKKVAKQAKKHKAVHGIETVKTTADIEITQKPATSKASNSSASKPPMPCTQAAVAAAVTECTEKTRQQIKAEREAKKAAKQAGKIAKATGNNVEEATQRLSKLKVAQSTPAVHTEQSVPEDKKKSTLTKAERRAIQELQRAAKAHKQQPVATASTSGKAEAGKIAKQEASLSTDKSPNESSCSSAKSTLSITRDNTVKLFNHLESMQVDASRCINDPQLHRSIARLGEQYAKRTIVGSNARCIAFLNALKSVVQDFVTPAKKEFARSLEAAVKRHVEHLHRCRPLAVSVNNAYKHFKHQLLQLPTDKPETELKELLSHFIDTYIENQIGKAALAISTSLQEKITDGDVLLTFGCSSLITYICEEAKRRQVDFRVVVVDSRPFCEGQEQLRRLTALGIPCTYVLINAVSFVMSEATKVLLGAHALLSNGYVMARTGTAQVALVAHSHNVPVLVCCETHKFSERFQTDAIVYNELGNSDDLIMNDKCSLVDWRKRSKMTPLNLNYDITPPELVTAVVTEVSILPCTSVPVILRIKPEIGY